MSQPLEHKRYMRAARAAKLVGYTTDYATRLAREGKVDAKQISGRWHIDPDSLKLFSLEAKAAKEDRKERLRQERVLERMGALHAAHESVALTQMQTTRRAAIVQTVVLAACVFLLGNIVWFSFESQLHVTDLALGVERVAAELGEMIAAPAPDLMSQVASFAFIEAEVANTDNTERTGSAPANSEQSGFDGIVVFDDEEVTPERVSDVRSSFSDEVNVQFDGDDTGVITPVFREHDGNAYRFLLVPIRSPGS